MKKGKKKNQKKNMNMYIKNVQVLVSIMNIMLIFIGCLSLNYR